MIYVVRNGSTMVYKVVLFDFFDVIHADHQKAWLAHNGYKREGEFAAASDSLDRGLIDFQEYASRYGKASGRSAAEVIEEMQAFGRIDDAVVDLIKALKENYKLGLVSNAHSDEIRPLLERYRLFDIFDYVCISSEVGMAKPDPAIFRHMLDKFGHEATEAIFIDDNSDNIAQALALGITGIVFQNAAQLREELQAHALQLSSA
jgi:HAD superfamily hydrolase (TIGR01509 family)